MILVDTNVLVDVLEDDPQWGDWSARQLAAQAKVHDLAINPIIYSELSLMFSTFEALDDQLDQMQIAYEELPRAALFLAGKAFVRYRKAGGTKQNVLSDFFVGAHAAVMACAVLTRDPKRYRSYFPSVKLLTPQPASG